MIIVDIDRREVKAGGRAVDSTPKEFDLLALLAQANGRVLSREQLQAAVWGHSAQTKSRTIDQHIARLRMKLGPSSKAIVTECNHGYKALVGAVTVLNPEKVPTGEVTAISRFFKNGKPAYKLAVTFLGECPRKVGDKVRVGV